MSTVDISIKVKKYRCFVAEFAGFDQIKPINIIVGRNNSGKSSLLDMLEVFASGKQQAFKAAFEIRTVLPEATLKYIFQPGTYGGILPGNSHWEDHGLHLSDLKLGQEIGPSGEFTLRCLNPEVLKAGPYNGYSAERWEKIQTYYKNKMLSLDLFEGKVVRKVSAERDIQREQKSDTLELTPTGGGATNIICKFVTDSHLDRDLIRNNFLDALNTIFRPDNEFVEIYPQDDKGTGKWEIYLEEANKGLVPLSKSGSGLKTVLLVLLNLLVVPKLKKNKEKKASEFLYVFEELENNLHPALLRRLLKYIADYAVKEKAHFFLTTHSNVAIDMFSRSPNAQIIHVAHDGKQATSKTIESFQDHSAVLDDIGVKASDLLQANGVVWLEGPSDRVYFNKWVELYSGGKLQEHRDYECAFYGGAVLTHFDAKDPLEDCDAVNVLRVNRNAILIGDSDRKAKRGHLKPRLRNMKKAMEDIGGLVWVTAAREVENYIPAYALCQRFEKSELPEIEQYEQFHHKPTGKKADEKGYWQKRRLSGTFAKVDFARSIVQHLKKEDLDKRFDLKAKMDAICEGIKEWNR